MKMTLNDVPFGTWPSELSPSAVAGASLRVGDVSVDGADLYWWEARPTEGGRGVVVRRLDGGEPSDITSADGNVRSLVHEYGGGAWTVRHGVVFHVELADQQIYESTGDGVRRVTDEPESRFADLSVHPNGTQLLAVRERHGSGSSEPINDLVAISIDSGAIRVIFSGTDFVSSPRPSRDGDVVAFITWSHPNMPWDHTELRIVDWAQSEEFGPSRTLISDEALQQPTWFDDRLLVVTDRTGWWLPHEVDQATGAAECLVDATVDAGLPPWNFGTTTIACHRGRMAVMWEADGFGHVGWLEGRSLIECEVDQIDFSSIDVMDNGSIVATASTATSPRGVVVISGDHQVEEVHQHRALLDDTAVSRAEHISFPSHDRTAHGLFYPPASSTAKGSSDELPPLLVLSHGGPTTAAQPGLDLSIQFWTSRGFAVVDVNYGGSTGYGREYRTLLNDSWGIIDVEDCIAAAQHLVEIGAVDGERLTIKGGSAGGYTTLAALAFHDVFSAGASRYGIGDLETLARDTHKFESRYLDGMIGPYPEAREVYVERSPIHSVDQITAPMIVLQGDEDKVVPPNQAEDIVAALAARGLPYAYLLFEGEQHGFRDAANIARAIEAEYVFFCRIFAIEPSGDPAPVDIIGLG